MSIFLILFSVTSTALTALFGLIISAILGFFIGRFFSNGGGEWKTKFEQKNAAYIELDKKFKAEGKHLNRLKQESQNWKHKFENLEESHNKVLAELEELKVKLADETAQKDKLQTELNQLNNAFERLSKEYDELRNKYRAEQKDTKAWRTEIELWKSEAEKYKNYFHKTDVRLKELQAMLKGRKELEAQLEQTRIEFKSQSHLVKQLNKDVKYWEEQHYKTHHELAALKIEMESSTKKTEDLNQLINGVRIEKQNLLTMIEEYKTKFIRKNNDYRELLEKYKSSNAVSSAN